MDMISRMEAIEPQTMAGFQAKTKMLLGWYWEHKQADEDDRGIIIALEIVRGLLTLN